MRIHQLTLSAFGPFPGTHVVDFEELNDAGVFLVTGPTGAGKTTILDGVCFALFGQVPGGRAVKALRSDHADPEAKPEVVLDFSLGGRRFEVHRTPEWSRPKRRGPGTTQEKASASLLEKTSGTDTLLSARAQEVGHFLSDLLGMTASQFQQVALLPQGEFQTFLRASSQERHDVLQQLFRTERFTRIEDWVNEHSRQLRDRAHGGEANVRRLVDTLADRAGVETPAFLGPDNLARSASEGSVIRWAEELAADARTVLAAAAAEHTNTARRVATVRDCYDQARRRNELRARRDRAQQVLDRLLDDSEIALSRQLVDAAERAARCAPMLRLLVESRKALATARAAHAAATASAPGIEDPRAASQRATVELARAQALLPRERELHQAQGLLRAAREDLSALGPRVAQAQEAVRSLPERRASLDEQVRRMAAAASARPACEADLARAEAAAESARLRLDAEAELTLLRDREREVRDAHAAAREHLLDVIARRLAGMAAELAADLRDGDPCKVCGSREHPAAAVSSVDAVDQAAQLAATALADDLRAAYETATALVRQSELRLEGLRQASANLSEDQASDRVTAARDALNTAVTAEQSQVELLAQLAALDREATRLQELLSTLETERGRLTQVLQGLEETASMIGKDLVAVLGDKSSLAEEVARLAGRVRALEVLAETTTARDRAQSSADRHEALAREAAHEQGFGDLDQVLLASLDEATQTQHAHRVAEYDRAVRGAQAVLADSATLDIDDSPTDPEALKGELAMAEVAEATAARQHHVRQEVTLALVAQLGALDQALAQWAPARERFLTAESMAKLVRGMSTDNQLQMRLSSYVLATRLDQVIEAANERLTHMREQRYLLERTGEATRRGTQAGLGLQVVDEWTGETRAPSTLSGGETFVVSLALALGLSDVVSTESGGVQIATLFIDEGFGMLDLDTLDDVMDRLDGLRAGGRTVGVVSHVTELRDRIPTQLHVTKQRHGSTVQVTTLIA